MHGEEGHFCRSRCRVLFEYCIPFLLMLQVNLLLIHFEEPLLSGSKDAVDVVEPDFRHYHKVPVEVGEVEGAMLAARCMMGDEDVDHPKGLHRGIALRQPRE
jgi:hypothetical protein